MHTCYHHYYLHDTIIPIRCRYVTAGYLLWRLYKYPMYPSVIDLVSHEDGKQSVSIRKTVNLEQAANGDHPTKLTEWFRFVTQYTCRMRPSNVTIRDVYVHTGITPCTRTALSLKAYRLPTFRPGSLGTEATKVNFIVRYTFVLYMYL